MFDVIISNATVIDGTGRSPYRADIGIQGDTIIAVDTLGGAVAREVFRAEDLYICPGFIDIHAHSDFNLMVDPPGRSKVMQGITTEVCGNCGMSAAPLYGPVRKQREATFAELGIHRVWATFSEYLELLEQQGLLCNMVPLLGHGNIRGAVLGYDNQQPNKKELAQMQGLLEQELCAGVWGLSSGLIYPPGIFARKDEIIELCRCVSRSGGIYATHMRSEGDQVLEAIAEAISIGIGASIAVQISHLKTLGRQNWHKLPEMFTMIETARDTGVRICADRYPYTAASTDLDVVLPNWACAGGNSAALARLKNPTLREQIVEYLRRGERGLAEEILIARVVTEQNKPYEGKRLGEIADMRGQAVVDTLLDLLIEESLRIDAIFFSMSEDNLREILKKDYIMIGSDAAVWDTEGVLGSGRPHPRAFGTFPRVLGHYVRDQRVLRLEQAVRKMTGQPAEVIGIPDRGFVRTGYKADLVVFDFTAICDNATYEQPHRFPSGIIGVMVNGSWVVQNNALTGTRPGKVLRRSEAVLFTSVGQGSSP
ncbi:MAG: D-aminoacylase [Desulfobacterota bacterium]|nr:D-aminoacylase [Thermodesulfobacteriota bacterium]